MNKHSPEIWKTVQAPVTDSLWTRLWTNLTVPCVPRLDELNMSLPKASRGSSRPGHLADLATHLQRPIFEQLGGRFGRR